VSSRTLRLGTRRSALALAQSGLVADSVRGGGHQVELVEVVTEGDRSSAAIASLGGTGVFVTELRSQLLDGRIDLAVHSLKDLPTQPANGLVVVAVPRRADPRDALVSRDRVTLAELPAGARIGTGSPRRAAQLRALGLGFEVVPLRGNVDTRVRRVSDGELDAARSTRRSRRCRDARRGHRGAHLARSAGGRMLRTGRRACRRRLRG
jgi:hydroxymethylbilane synthase